GHTRLVSDWSSDVCSSDLTSKAASPCDSCSASPTSNVMLRFSCAASCFAVSISPGERSEPVTSAPARAARSATAPVPVPTSSHFSSGWVSSARTRCSWRFAISFATFSNGPALHIFACRCFSSSNAIRRFLLFRSCGQLIACAPEGREEVVVDHLPEHLDRRPLRADDLVADHARNDLVVANAPHGHALVPLDQRLGELIELLVVASLDVELDEVQARHLDCLLERLAERRSDAADLPEAGRVEPAAVPEHAPNRLVLPRRHLLEHVQLPRDELQAERRAAEQ